MPHQQPRLSGFRVLVVEDEFLVSIALEDDLREAGAMVIGPFNDLQSGRAGVARESFDIAVLDVNLNGEMIYPLADALMLRGVPFLFLSGYSAANMPSRFVMQRRVAKPYDLSHLVDEILKLKPSPEGTSNVR